MEKELKSFKSVLLRPDLTGHGHPNPFCQNGCDGRALLTQPLKDHPCRISVLFSIMFYCIISTTYQKIVDRFCPVIFLVFHTVWLGRNQVYCSCCSAKTAHKLVLTGLASRQQALRDHCPNIYTVSKGHRQWP